MLSHVYAFPCLPTPHVRPAGSAGLTYAQWYWHLTQGQICKVLNISKDVSEIWGCSRPLGIKATGGGRVQALPWATSKREIALICSY